MPAAAGTALSIAAVATAAVIIDVSVAAGAVVIFFVCTKLQLE